MKLEHRAHGAITDAAIAAAAIMAFEDAQRVKLAEGGESHWKQAGRREALR
jgi:hypothetical protein